MVEGVYASVVVVVIGWASRVRAGENQETHSVRIHCSSTELGDPVPAPNR